MAKIKTRSSTSHKTRPRGVHPKAFEKVHWPYLPILLAISFLLAFGVPSGRLAVAAKHPSGKVLDYATSMSISGLLSATNAQRVGNGVSSLSLNAKLDAAAQAKAEDMAARNYWSHNTPEGNPPWGFVTAQGYAYQKLGENLATGFSDEQATINGWMASPPHRENLLDPAYKEVGFGYANNPNYTSAGGGPMTIVVAFYGLPVNAVPPPAPAPTPRPVARTQPPPPVPTPAPASQPVASQQEASPQPPPPSTNDAVQAKPQPVTTETPPAQGVTLAFRSSNSQLAFARVPNTSMAAGLASFALISAGGLWLSRHLLILRRVLVRGETYMVHHPLVDVGLLLITILAYLLTRTAGYIQ